MDPRDEWKPQEPPSDFVDRVMAEVERSRKARPARRLRPGSWRIAGTAAALGVAAGVALAVTGYYRRASSHGEMIAAERTQVAVGTRAALVLEPGAHVTWSGDDVQQSAGDVFYRVEPGGAFRVHTPAGDVQVLGTCFRVHLEDAERAQREESVVNGRDIKVGVIGGVVATAALVSAYEGKVAVSHGKASVTLTAGESARADGAGVRRASVDGMGAVDEGASVLAAANENLADQVQDYKRRLDAITTQKATAEKQLADAQKKLAAAQTDGQATTPGNPYDPSPAELKQLAANGEVHSRVPCLPTSESQPTTVTASTIAGDGLPPGDLQPINAAVQQTTSHVWATIRPFCIQALDGKADVADAIGPQACKSVIFELAKTHEDTDEELREVAEIRAGERPLPKDMSSLGQVGQIIYQMSGESKALEQQLTQTIGPDDARAFVYGDKGCWSNDSWGAGPRNPAPGTPVVTGTSGSGL